LSLRSEFRKKKEEKLREENSFGEHEIKRSLHRKLGKGKSEWGIGGGATEKNWKEDALQGPASLKARVDGLCPTEKVGTGAWEKDLKGFTTPKRGLVKSKPGGIEA